MIASRATTAGNLHVPVSLEGKVAVVTGASSGIGRAIAVALAREKAALRPVGRNEAELRRTAEFALALTSDVRPFRMDLTEEQNIDSLAEDVRREFGRCDVLIHSAGVIHESRMSESQTRHLDSQYLANVRAPYALTRALLTALKTARGQVVFINSTVGLSAKRADIGQFSSTQFALRAIADSLREEVNPDGVRVLTVHPGRTATPRQEAFHRRSGKPYCPELLMQPEDVASIVIHALTLPRTAEITDITVRPMLKT